MNIEVEEEDKMDKEMKNAKWTFDSLKITGPKSLKVVGEESNVELKMIDFYLKHNGSYWNVNTKCNMIFLNIFNVLTRHKL